jgi:hypothetical protein
MIETKEKEINGATYMVTQMTARRAIRMQARLVKLLGSFFSQLYLSGSNDPLRAEMAFPNAVKVLAENLDEKTFEQLVLDLTQGVRKDGMELKPEVIDLEFAGKLNDLFLLLVFILEANFSDFFAEGGILQALIKEAQAPAQISPKLKQG